MKFTFKVNKQVVQKAYKDILSQHTKTTSIKGFRKGKAPAKLVEEKIGRSSIEKQALEQTLPFAYSKVIKTKKLSPVSYPEINLKTVEKNGDWVFQAQIAQKPTINLGSYQKALKAAAFKNKTKNQKIWVPGKDDPKSGNEEQPSKEDATLKLIFDALLDTIELKIPKLLIDREVSRSLSRLLEQIEKLGLNFEDYLKSINKTKDGLKEDYKKTATESLKLEFILQEIAIKENLNVTDSEVENFIKAIPDAQQSGDLSSQEAKINIKLVLLKRKTIDRLSSYVA